MHSSDSAQTPPLAGHTPPEPTLVDYTYPRYDNYPAHPATDATRELEPYPFADPTSEPDAAELPLHPSVAPALVLGALGLIPFLFVCAPVGLVSAWYAHHASVRNPRKYRLSAVTTFTMIISLLGAVLAAVLVFGVMSWSSTSVGSP